MRTLLLNSLDQATAAHILLLCCRHRTKGLHSVRLYENGFKVMLIL